MNKHLQDFHMPWAVVRKKYCLIIAILSLAGCSLNAGTLSCNLKLRFVRADGSLDFNGNAQLVADLDSGSWLISYFDNNQKFAYNNGSMVIEKPNRSGANSWYIVSSTVDTCPVDLDSDYRLIWFAYCAKTYIQQHQGKPVVLPFGDTRLDDYVYGTRMKANWPSHSALCPAVVDFGFDRRSFDRGIKNLTFEPAGSFLNDRENQIATYGANSTNNQIIATFAVQQWTNAGDIQIAARWRLDLLLYSKPALICYGDAHDFQVTSQKIAAPRLSESCLITDKRIMGNGINSVRYNITDGKIPSLADIRIPRISNPTYQMPPNQKAIRAVMVSLLAIVLVAPVIVLLYKKSRPCA